MNLGQLAFACYVYAHMTDFDSSYHRFQTATEPRLDLRQEPHRMALLQWLNDWGCRQFAKEYHSSAAREIETWYEEIEPHLFQQERALLSLTHDELAVTERAYDALLHRRACVRTLPRGRKAQVEFGPTGAAKILFALRPNALLPWDQPMREMFRLDGSAPAYRAYLDLVRGQIDELSRNCEEQGYTLEELPTLLNRPGSSIVKLVDEYFWVTVSRACPAPSKDVLAHWASW